MLNSPCHDSDAPYVTTVFHTVIFVSPVHTTGCKNVSVFAMSCFPKMSDLAQKPSQNREAVSLSFLSRSILGDHRSFVITKTPHPPSPADSVSLFAGF